MSQCTELVNFRTIILFFPFLLLEGIIDIENPVSLYILHYIFLPRINKVISSFTESWNNHPLRTEKNWSPVQLWTNGMIDMRNKHIQHIAELQNTVTQDSVEDLEWFGADWNAPHPSDDGLSTVNVDDVQSPLSSEQEQCLKDLDPLSVSSNFGIDILVHARSSILSLVSP